MDCEHGPSRVQSAAMHASRSPECSHLRIDPSSLSCSSWIAARVPDRTIGLPLRTHIDYIAGSDQMHILSCARAQWVPAACANVARTENQQRPYSGLTQVRDSQDDATTGGR